MADRPTARRPRTLGGLVVAEEVELFSTFGGNPVACAAALAVLAIIEDEVLQVLDEALAAS
jgi:4-aminobutyrate aminotransferase-like enzyme